MAGTGEVGSALVNQVRSYASAAYQNQVPVLNNQNLAVVGNMILNFQPIYNEFINVFFNKVTLEIMDSRRYLNPFRELTKGGTPLGGVIQNTQVNPAEAIPYDVNATSRLLHNYKPDVAVEYYSLNRQDLFAVTRARQALELAFSSFEQLDKFFTEIIDSLYNGNEIREFSLYKALMASAFLNDVVRKVKCATPVDKETATAFLTMLQQYSLAFTFPSSNYNNFQKLAADQGYAVSPRKTWTPQDRQIVVMDSRLAPIIGEYVQASAFNEQYTRLQGRILYVDDFAVTGLLAIIADDAWMQVRDSKREFRDFENGATLTLNSFFHVWQYYNICTWANAIALYDDNATPLKISGLDSDIEVDVDATADAEISVDYGTSDLTESAVVDFISSSNNFVMKWDPTNRKIKVVTNKYSVPGEYKVLVTATANVNTQPVSNSVIATVVIS